MEKVKKKKEKKKEKPFLPFVKKIKCITPPYNFLCSQREPTYNPKKVCKTHYLQSHYVELLLINTDLTNTVKKILIIF